MGIISTLTLTGSVASIIGLFLPAEGWKRKAIYVIYGLVIALLTGGLVYYQQQLEKAESISRQAEELVEDRSIHFTSEGFIQAGLAFLETHQDTYPDTYARAQAICETYNCSGEGEDVVSAAFAMEGILEGIANIHGGT